MMTLKIFNAEDMFWILTTTKEKALEILIDEDMVDEDCTLEEINIKECNYKNETYQPIEILKNILSKDDFEEIRENMQYNDVFTMTKNNTLYTFEDKNHDLGYIGVNISFEEILKNKKILSEFDKNTIISTTEY